MFWPDRGPLGVVTSCHLVTVPAEEVLSHLRGEISAAKLVANLSGLANHPCGRLMVQWRSVSQWSRLASTEQWTPLSRLVTAVVNQLFAAAFSKVTTKRYNSDPSIGSCV